MTFLQMSMVFVIVYPCFYALIGRICRCIEHCAIARAYSKLRENGVEVKLDDIEAGIRTRVQELDATAGLFIKK